MVTARSSVRMCSLNIVACMPSTCLCCSGVSSDGSAVAGVQKARKSGTPPVEGAGAPLTSPAAVSGRRRAGAADRLRRLHRALHGGFSQIHARHHEVHVDLGEDLGVGVGAIGRELDLAAAHIMAAAIPLASQLPRP